MTSDFCAIERLVYQYAAFLDAGDFDALGQLLDSASLTYLPLGKTMQGGGAIATHYKNTIIVYPDTGTPCTSHHVSNLMVDVDGNKASSNALFTAWQCFADTPPIMLAMGRYSDRFTRVEGVWQFNERRVLPQYFGDLSRHIQPQDEWQKKA